MPLLTVARWRTLNPAIGTDAAIDIQVEESILQVQERIATMAGARWVVPQLSVVDTVTFATTTLTADGADYSADYGFAAGDDIYIGSSYRNDGYFALSSASNAVLTLNQTPFGGSSTVSTSWVDELEGASVIVGVVRWPIGLQGIAARFVTYDVFDRTASPGLPGARAAGVQTQTGGMFGYPRAFITELQQLVGKRFI